jgi:hypothetical protein
MYFATEKELQDYAVAYLHAKGFKCRTEVRVGSRTGGRIDILTEDHLIECKLTLNRKTAYEAIGQLQYYKSNIKGDRQLIILACYIKRPELISLIENAGIDLWISPNCFEDVKLDEENDSKIQKTRNNVVTQDERDVEVDKGEDIESIEEDFDEDPRLYKYPKLFIAWKQESPSGLNLSGSFYYRCKWVDRYDFDEVSIALKQGKKPILLYEEEFEQALQDFEDISEEVWQNSGKQMALKMEELGIDIDKGIPDKYLPREILYEIRDTLTGRTFARKIELDAEDQSSPLNIFQGAKNTFNGLVSSFSEGFLSELQDLDKDVVKSFFEGFWFGKKNKRK